MSPITIRKRPIKIHTSCPIKLLPTTPTICPRAGIIINPIRLAAVDPAVVRRAAIVRRDRVLALPVVAGVGVAACAGRGLGCLPLYAGWAVVVVVHGAGPEVVDACVADLADGVVPF